MASYEDNMNDLMNAAKIKLEAQKKQNEESPAEAPQEDIYASMREEVENYKGNTEKLLKNENTGYTGNKIYHEPFNESEIEESYIDPNDTPIFEGGPGISSIDLWKKQFEKEKVIHVQVIDKHFVFRTLNRYEYKQIVAIENIDALHREEIICSTCTLWPSNYDFKTMASDSAGYPSTLAQIIMESSGFTKEYGIEVL